MRLTKFEHACFVVENDGQSVVVDPGSFTSPLLEQRGVVAIVITHEHPDHWTPEQIRRILDTNPDARIFSTPAVVAAAADANIAITAVHDGDTQKVGGFTLGFYGQKHAVIHSSIPVVDNVGVIINDSVFYSGDAFTIPPGEVDVLAVPASGPWQKIAEVIDYVAAVTPKRTFPTHEMVNSVIGNGMANDRIGTATREGGGEFVALAPGDQLEL